MVVHRNQVVSRRGPVGCPGLDLERDAEVGDFAVIGDINVCVLAEVVLLANFLKRASVVLEKRACSVYSISTRNSTGHPSTYLPTLFRILLSRSTRPWR
jgi:hypothetical protein